MHRGSIWWADLPSPSGAGPGYRRPILIIQADAFNTSRIATVIAVVITSNLRLAAAPGNVLLRASESGLPRDSVINVSQIITLDKADLEEQIGVVSARTLTTVEEGIQLVLDL
ncbi:type II toxin-antitoxin system PemK/MazF family toxin [bacterium]|nr:type II toxin-antitoxin system PemK/MazF family toxin [bacterium]